MDFKTNCSGRNRKTFVRIFLIDIFLQSKLKNVKETFLSRTTLCVYFTVNK